VFLGSTGNDAGFILNPPPSQNGIAFCDGGFASAGGKIVFGAQIPPPQLFPSVLLNEINFALQLDPTLVRGGGRISVANLSDVSGTFLAAFPSPAAPYVLSTEDAGKDLAPLAGRTLTSTSFALGGTMGLQLPAVGRIPFGNAYLLYSYPDYVALGGSVRVVVPGMSIEGGIDGEASGATKRFSLHGAVEACVAGLPLVCPGFEGWVTSNGIVACAKGTGLHPGAGYHWGDDWPTIWWIDGCKPSRYWVTVRAARAAAEPLTFTVVAGERAKNVRLRGSGGAPSVEIRGPDGELVSTAAGTFAAGRTIQVVRQDEGKTTWIGVANGKPGKYTVTTLPGSAPIASLAATRKGYGEIKASVTGTGRRRALRYDLGPPGGQRVTFFERGEATFRQLGTATAGRGAIRFVPALGRAGTREIVAEMQVDGVPAPDRVVARYRAPGSVKTSRPRAVVVERHGTALLISWTRVADATSYGVVVKQRTGDSRMIKVSARSHSVRVAGIAKTQNGTVAVSARGPLGDWGRPRAGRFRATARPFTVLRPFKLLGRGGRGRR
jgi:hypothetical protein